MLKGHVQIDIHNHNSGFTERYEQDNLVTNALSTIVAASLGGNQSANTAIMPIATKALGALMLFDGTLTEDINNIYFPSEAHYVGYAGQYVNTTNPMTGSINNAESGPISNGYKTVWDFNTSQCNVTIQSLARCMQPYSGGTPGDANYLFCGINDFYAFHPAITASGNVLEYMPIVYDSGSQNLYSFYYQEGYYYDSSESQAWYRPTFNLYTNRIPLEKYSVRDAANTSSYPTAAGRFIFPIAYTNGEMSSLFGGTSNPAYMLRNAYDGYAYIAFGPRNASGDGQVSYYKVAVDDLSFDVSGPYTISMPDCQLYGRGGAIVNQGKCFCIGDSHYIYIVDLANPTDIQTIDIGAEYKFVTNTTSQSVLSNFRNGVVKTAVYKESEIEGRYDWSDMLVYPDGTFVRNTPFLNDTSLGYPGSIRYARTLITDQLMAYGNTYGNKGNGYMVSNYLGTICNLANEVTKTSDSSMKITYTLTDVNLEE